MCVCHHPHNLQYCQPVSELWSFPPSFQTVDCFPLLKKSTLDNEQLSNYRPISNLSLIFKIIERVVKSRLTDHLFSHNLLNPHQSACRRHHSTETSLLYIHDHVINATNSQNFLVSVSSTTLLPLTVQTMTFYSLGFHPGLALTALFSTG